MNLAGFDLNLLRVLDALMQDRSTVKAGRRIGLSQPAVSSALGRLRHALNDPLFVRQGQKFVPTDFAGSLELPLRRIIDDLEALLSGADKFDPLRAEHSFKLSGSDFFAEMLMPALADTLSVRAPEMRVQLVDLALMPMTEFPDWIDFAPVFRSNFVMIARDGHPRLARVARKRRVVMTMPVFGGVCNAVAGSDLIALIPEQLARRKARHLGLSIYKPPMPVVPVVICMIWHKRNCSDRAHLWLRALVKEILAPLNLPVARAP